MWSALIQGVVAFVARLFKVRSQDEAAAQVEEGQRQVDATEADLKDIEADLKKVSPQ